LRAILMRILSGTGLDYARWVTLQFVSVSQSPLSVEKGRGATDRRLRLRDQIRPITDRLYAGLTNGDLAVPIVSWRPFWSVPIPFSRAGARPRSGADSRLSFAAAAATKSAPWVTSSGGTTTVEM
jgi:hypothetical protein